MCSGLSRIFEAIVLLGPLLAVKSGIESNIKRLQKCRRNCWIITHEFTGEIADKNVGQLAEQDLPFLSILLKVHRVAFVHRARLT
jgi:hypothetical protein